MIVVHSFGKAVYSKRKEFAPPLVVDLFADERIHFQGRQLVQNCFPRFLKGSICSPWEVRMDTHLGEAGLGELFCLPSEKGSNLFRRGLVYWKATRKP